MNLDVIKQKLAKLQEQKQSGGSKKLWKPTGGKDVIRILPYKFNKDNPFSELLFHYEFNKKSYLSPATTNEADPIVEFSKKLKSTGVKDDWKLGRKLEPKLRVYVPIIVRGEEDAGVKFWGFGKEVYSELLAIISDPDYGDITDPVHGRDVTVQFESADSTGRSFASTKILVKPNIVPATTNKTQLTKWLDEQDKVESLFTAPTYAELEAILQAYLEVSDAEETQEGTKPESTSLAEVEKEFEGLMDDDATETAVAPAPTKKAVSKKKK